MKKLFTKFFLCTFIISACNQEINMKEPQPKQIPFKMEAHGDVRIDNYYWLRDDTRSDPEILTYLESENEYFENWISQNSDYRNQIFTELESQIPLIEETLRVKENNYLYYTRIKSSDQYQTYFRSKNDIEEIILDVNIEAGDNEFYSAAGLNVSPNENLLVFGEDLNGRREYNLKIKNLTSNEYLEDNIEGASPSAIWSADSQYLLYTKKDEVTLISNKVYVHKIGDDQSQDILIYEEKDNEFNIYIGESRSKKYAVIYVGKTDSNEIYLLDKDDFQSSLKLISSREDGHEYSIDHFGEYFYILSNKNNAKNFQIFKIEESDFNKSNQWDCIIPARDFHYIEDMIAYEDNLVLITRFDGLPTIELVNLPANTISTIEMPDDAYDVGLSYNNDVSADFFRFSYSSPKSPSQIFEYNLKTQSKKIVWKKQINNFFENDYQVSRIKTSVRDNSVVPVTIIHKKNINTAEAPLLIYGYGSYGINMDSGFRASIVPLLERGFIFAIAQIRGGSDLGREWYEDGRMLNKKNTFYDFIDATKYLIANNIGHPKKLFAMGGSAGGLLMGAVINFEPKLYQGIISAVPFVDVLTTMSDESIPLTTFEYDEWGDPRIKEQYDYMKSYSPYDNINSQEYPSVLVTTSLFDSQVQYFEPAKYVPKLRENTTSNNPIFLSINLIGGHGGKSGRLESLRETARDYTFILNVLENS